MPDKPPFYAGTYNGHDCFHQTVTDRLLVLKTLDAEQCQVALATPGLQTVVKRALEARLRKLEKAPLTISTADIQSPLNKD